MTLDPDHPDNAVRDELVALRPRLQRFAYGLCGSRADADDLVQSAFERALTRLHQWQPGTRLDSWMYRIIQSTWLNFAKSRAVRTRHHAAMADELPAPVAAGPEAALTFDAVRRELYNLPEEQKSALLLVAVEGLSYREAAEVLEINQGTLTSRVGRARATLRERTQLWSD